MPHQVFNRETLLDVSVNVVPLVILAFFIALFLVTSPWPPSTFVTVIVLGLHLVPLILLALLTYVTAHYI